MLVYGVGPAESVCDDLLDRGMSMNSSSWRALDTLCLYSISSWCSVVLFLVSLVSCLLGCFRLCIRWGMLHIGCSLRVARMECGVGLSLCCRLRLVSFLPWWTRRWACFRSLWSWMMRCRWCARSRSVPSSFTSQLILYFGFLQSFLRSLQQSIAIFVWFLPTTMKRARVFRKYPFYRMVFTWKTLSNFIFNPF